MRKRTGINRLLADGVIRVRFHRAKARDRAKRGERRKFATERPSDRAKRGERRRFATKRSEVNGEGSQPSDNFI